MMQPKAVSEMVHCRLHRMADNLRFERKVLTVPEFRTDNKTEIEGIFAAIAKEYDINPNDIYVRQAVDDGIKSYLIAEGVYPEK